MYKPPGKTHLEAVWWCRALGGELLSVGSQSEIDQIQSWATRVYQNENAQNLWVSPLYDNTQQKWVNGDKSTFDPASFTWARGQPATDTGVVLSSTGGKLDWQDKAYPYRFVCQERTTKCPHTDVWGLCLKLLDERKTYTEAVQACQTLSAKLLTFDQKDRYVLWVWMLQHKLTAWTSAHQQNGVWKWADNSDVNMADMRLSSPPLANQGILMYEAQFAAAWVTFRAYPLCEFDV